LTGHVQAQTTSLAVNAGTGNASTIYNMQDTYRPFASLLGKALSSKIEVKPLLASLVKSAINGNQYPLLLVYTSDAAEAIKSKRYEVIGFSQDLGDNHIYFFARNDSSAKTLADAAGRCVVAADPFAIATGEAILKKENLFSKVLAYKYVRESDALESYLQTKSCEIAVFRSDTMAQKLKAAGHKQIYKTAEFPVYALLVDKKIGAATIKKMRKMIVEFESEPTSAFMKETGIVTFITNQESAVELISLY
jgi:ABC-type phosphate/phosphonate transport system substrate-binding protein